VAADEDAVVVGQQVEYIERSGEAVIVRVVHVEQRPLEEPFFTVQFPNGGGERQTERTRLRVLSAADIAAAAGADAMDALADELTGLPVRDLRKRASEMGIDGDAIEEARDSLDPPSALIALIVEALASALACDEAELAAMSVRELRQRAVEVGVGDDAIEDARDGMDPPGELRALIAQRAQGRGAG
jgi:hypothetical protein